jgi:predicted ATPase
MTDRRLLSRVVLRNYKSIAACDVRPAQLSFLVGPNGSGKSNLLDGLRFVADSLRFSLDHALRDRGGINEVRRRSSGHPTHFGLRLEFNLSMSSGHYSFNVGARPRGGYEIQREECLVVPRTGSGSAYYKVEGGLVVKTAFSPSPAAARDRLYLVTVSGVEAFRPVYDALSGMGFYNLNPEEIRDLQPPDPGELLKRDGANIASVLSNLAARSPEVKKRIEEYLAKVVPGIAGVDSKSVGPKETLEFRQDIRGAKYPWRFLASNMSDGTLRAFGVLVALFQGAANGDSSRRLVGIEEPEIALHPAAAGILTDSLQDASDHSQILVTSHSPDLLDNEAIPDESILAVVADHGETRVGRLDDAGRSALRDRLYTAGELLRMDQLRPDPSATTLNPDQLELFGPEL